MPDLTIIPRARQPIIAPSKPGKVTGRLKQAIDLMVWDALTDNEAAIRTGITVGALRISLQRPHVRAYLRQQREVFLAKEGPANINALISVRDGTNEMARVSAVRALEQMSEETQVGARPSVSLPGLTIQIVNAPAIVTDAGAGDKTLRSLNDVTAAKTDMLGPPDPPAGAGEGKNRGSVDGS